MPLPEIASAGDLTVCYLPFELTCIQKQKQKAKPKSLPTIFDLQTSIPFK